MVSFCSNIFSSISYNITGVNVTCKKNAGQWVAIQKRVFKEKTKAIFIENILATALINSFLSTSRFFLILHFEMILQVIIYIIYINEPDNSDH